MLHLIRVVKVKQDKPDSANKICTVNIREELIPHQHIEKVRLWHKNGYKYKYDDSMLENLSRSEDTDILVLHMRNENGESYRTKILEDFKTFERRLKSVTDSYSKYQEIEGGKNGKA